MKHVAVRLYNIYAIVVIDGYYPYFCLQWLSRTTNHML